MFDRIFGMLRTAALTAIPSSVYSADRILFDALDKDSTPNPTAQKLVAVTQENTESRQVSTGTRPMHRMEGTLVLTMYDKTGKGDGDQITNGTAMANYLRSRRIVEPSITITLGSPTLVNGERSGSFWVRLLRVPFRADFFPTVNS